MPTLSDPLTLPCGAVLANRIAKAAMTEGLADAHDQPTEGHCTLYRTWSKGGAALHLTGNVMIDRRFLERPGNVVLDEDTDLVALSRWAAAGTEGGNHLWMQLNHPGRQCQRLTSSQPLAPSPVQLKLGGLFAQPRAMTPDEIEEAIARIGWCARTAVASGFTGVQVHAAHGYLASQFLSPRTNQRTDDWGGSLDNRARYLLQAVAAARDAVGSEVPVSVKLNSADFSKGGFSNDDAMQVAAWLHEAGVDLLEISGGTYESVAFIDGAAGDKAQSTRRREAYFLDFARSLRERVPDLPLMVTGGFRTRELMHQALDEGALDVIGLARPFCVQPDLAHGLLDGSLDRLDAPESAISLGPGLLGPASGNKTVRAFNSQTSTAWFYHQIYQMADGRPPQTGLSSWGALMRHLWRDTTRGIRRKGV